MKEAVETLCDLNQLRSPLTLLVSVEVPGTTVVLRIQKENGRRLSTQFLSMNFEDAASTSLNYLACKFEAITLKYTKLVYPTLQSIQTRNFSEKAKT